MTVSLWQHLIVVLTLLGLEVWTVTYAMRRISDLRAALTAKAVLLGRHEAKFEEMRFLAPGETMSLQDTAGNLLEIHSRDATLITVNVFDR